ncbi:MAG TPA: C25 family cysteine peptidase [candidate division Zixibacteria bacterium]|nr:C25 family cysteine peptidase [candidate division Zixibacteria bacterium]
MSFRGNRALLFGLAVLVGAGVKAATLDESMVTPRVEVQSSKTNVTCEGFESIALGADLVLPGKTFLVELSDSESNPQFTVIVGETAVLGQVDRSRMYCDETTSDRPNEYANVTSSSATERLGQYPVELIDIVTVNGRRYARLLYFPVTVDSLNNLVFARQTDLKFDGNLLSSEQLLRGGLDRRALSEKSNRAGQTLSANGPKYLIVTSALLDSTCEDLAAYKRETGYNAWVEDIDEILLSYSGRDEAERLRNRLKSFYAEGGEYVLLAGDETQLPIRYAYPSMTSAMPDTADLQVCDLYFADLTGEWDSDSDGVWGEKYADQADLTPELLLGRLPFSRPEEVTNYTNKLIAYETNPGNGDLSYLTRAFFYSSDQMRDYGDGGEHGLIAAAFPSNFQIDTIHGIEQSRGDDVNPTNLSAGETIPILSSGYGIVNVIAHGRSDAFGVRTTGYNEWPKSYFMTTDVGGTNGDANNMEPNGKTSFYYSLACDNGGFDLDQPPMNEPDPNLVETLLGLPDAGAVGFVAHTRWGWIASSHLVQKTFFDSLFAHPGRPAVCAMYDTKAVFYYYRDQVYGIDYFGDPTLKVYTGTPKTLSLTTSVGSGNVLVSVNDESGPVVAAAVIVSRNGAPIFDGVTDGSGQINLPIDLYEDSTYTIAAIKTGATIGFKSIQPSIVTGVNESNDQLPRDFELAQNYPNPFNPSTTIGFSLPARSKVVLEVFDVLGRRVRTLADGNYTSGRHEVVWDGETDSGSKVSSGIYFYRLQANAFSATKKMLLLK